MAGIGRSGRNRSRTRTVGAECDTIDVVEFSDEIALMTTIMAQKSMAGAVLNTTSALSSSRRRGFNA